MLVWQSRLNKDYSFEFVIQESRGRGYQKIENRYKPAYIADTDPSKIFQVVLALKMVEKAEELLKQVDSDIKIDVQMPEDTEEELAEAYEEISAESIRKEIERETDIEPELEQVLVYEVEVDGQEYEVELPVLKAEDVKRKSFWRRFGMRRVRRGRNIDELEAVGELELEHDIKDVEFELETFLRTRR